MTLRPLVGSEKQRDHVYKKVQKKTRTSACKGKPELRRMRTHDTTNDMLNFSLHCIRTRNSMVLLFEG